MLNSHIRQYICKNTKNIQKSDYMDGFCWQGELDLTLFYKIEGYFENANSTSKCKITKCFCKSTPLVLRNSISFLVSH